MYGSSRKFYKNDNFDWENLVAEKGIFFDLKGICAS